MTIGDSINNMTTPHDDRNKSDIKLCRGHRIDTHFDMLCDRRNKCIRYLAYSNRVRVVDDMLIHEHGCPIHSYPYYVPVLEIKSSSVMFLPKWQRPEKTNPSFEEPPIWSGQCSIGLMKCPHCNYQGINFQHCGFNAHGHDIYTAAIFKCPSCDGTFHE